MPTRVQFSTPGGRMRARRVSIASMKSIREILTGQKPVTISPTINVIEAAKLMKEARVGALLVKDDETGALGVFSERDLMTRVVVPGLDPEQTTVRSVMTSEIFSASPDRRINDVAVEMQDRHIRHLPVIEDGVVVAMLSLRDLLRAHIAIKRSEVQELKSYIQGEG